MKVWRLKSGMDRRFNAGHPWVYSNELLDPLAGLPPGAPVELRNARGDFLARGYGNPASLIAFRVLSRDPSEAEPTRQESILKRIQNAAQFRKNLGRSTWSHRLCFGEADFLPGLIIDRYFLAPPQGIDLTKKIAQVFVVQSHTAGTDQMLPNILEILEQLVRSEQKDPSTPWEQTGVISRNDSGMRKREGLSEEEPRILKALPGINFLDTSILVPAPQGLGAVTFRINLFSGQKTGFFLDQLSNIQAVTQLLSTNKSLSSVQGGTGDTIQILDLCSYVGQWGAQLSRFLHQKLGKPVKVHAVDASAPALQFAQHNIEAQGIQCVTFKGDVLRDLETLPLQSYSLVICDPPALIKGRKHLPQGKQAYLQLNTQVFRLIKPGGLVISCSCSALLEEEEFLKLLSKASHRNKKITRWIWRGFQSSDHPVLAEFPEGRYLKAWGGLC
jgi:23S rRNA (cytosine1962-C5)-methyltransferase